MNAEKYIKPTFKKAGNDDFYHNLHKEVQLKVLSNTKFQQRVFF